MAVFVVVYAGTVAAAMVVWAVVTLLGRAAWTRCKRPKITYSENFALSVVAARGVGACHPTGNETGPAHRHRPRHVGPGR